MNKFIKFFNYNWFIITKKNFKNNKKIKLKDNESKIINNLIIKKEICALLFVIINFLITYTSSIEIYKMTYQNNIFFNILKDNITPSFIWFIILSILPIISTIILKKQIKAKYYLILDSIYLLSNLYNIIMIAYFITTFINNIIIGIIGIINILLTIIINSNIIIKINDNYLNH